MLKMTITPPTMCCIITLLSHMRCCLHHHHQIVMEIKKRINLKGRYLKKFTMHMLLNWYNIILCCIFTSHYNTLKASWEDTLCPLASCCNWLGRRDNHEHIVISLNNSHYTNRASFFNIPTNTRICKFRSHHLIRVFQNQIILK